MIKFGTSGFRGIVGDNFTKENIQKIAFALCEIAKNENIKKPNVVIGYDTRFMSRDFAKWASEVLATSMNVEFYEQAVPTPLISFVAKNYSYGMIITASHNPYYYNGLKIILNEGREADDEFVKKIEKIANKVKVTDIKVIDFEEGLKSKKIVYTKDIKCYCSDILKHINVKKIQKSNLKILVDCMHGNGAECTKYVFDKLKVKYELMNDDVDPYFENKLPAPYKENMEDLAKRVKKENFDFGFAYDGDSDRFSLVTSSGKYYDCNYVGAVLFYYLVKVRGYNGGVSKNFAATTLIEKIANELDQKCYNLPVGFKNIAKSLIETDSFIGIEAEGISFKEHALHKDGIFVAAMFLDMICAFGKKFEDILLDLIKVLRFESQIVEFAYPISAAQKEKISNLLFVQKKYPKIKGKKVIGVDYPEGCRVLYENGYWVMFRFSGNEPVIRIFVEMKDLKECEMVVKEYEKFIGVKTRQF